MPRTKSLEELLSDDKFKPKLINMLKDGTVDNIFRTAAQSLAPMLNIESFEDVARDIPENDLNIMSLTDLMFYMLYNVKIRGTSLWEHVEIIISSNESRNQLITITNSVKMRDTFRSMDMSFDMERFGNLTRNISEDIEGKDFMLLLIESLHNSLGSIPLTH